jgi:hypothetical protein
MADNEHVISFSKRHQGVGRFKQVFVRLRMDEFPFHDILGRDAVEMLLDQTNRSGIGSHKLATVQRGTDVKGVLKYILQRGLT